MAVYTYPDTAPGVFVRRNNRFTAEVLVGGRQETVHVKNTGRLAELLLPGAAVTLQRSDRPERKTAFDLISVYKPPLEWVNVDSAVPNALMRRYFEEQGCFVRPEYTYGSSRLDLYMEKAGRKYLAEIKGCTLAGENGTGLFPDAPTQRGVRHLAELTSAVRDGYMCSIVFVIQMNGIHRVLPNTATHPEFGAALASAAEAGVRVLCASCAVDASAIRVTSVLDDTASHLI
ncbi:MAG: DNA/RNA nuclease SfsA [Clostridia bacterium]|nr:DNA/RNA nuclease SfsA [Clostridia bacterium]